MENYFGFGTLFLLLFYIPGYIYLKVADYFLIKRDKTQFERTVQGFIASMVLIVSFIFIEMLVLKFVFKSNNIISIKKIVNLLLSQYSGNDLIALIASWKSVALYFLLLLYCVICSFFYTIIIKISFVKRTIQGLTGRDYFDRVEFGFYTNALGKVVVVTLKNGDAYLGYLVRAPDNESDRQIMLKDVYFLKAKTDKKSFEALSCEYMLLNLENVENIQLMPQIKDKGDSK